MMISLVVAVSKNGVIGRDGQLPWHLPSELKRFKDITFGKPIIMGRKTWDSLPKKPLPGRTNIVVTRQDDFRADGAVIVSGMDAARVAAAATGAPECCVIGGGDVYLQFLPEADRIYLTVVDVEVDGDTHFPALAHEDWVVTQVEQVPAGPRDSANFEIRILDSKQR